MVKVVVLKEEDVNVRSDLVGTWLDDSHYKVLVEEDMDLYLPPSCAMDITNSCDKDCSNCDSGLNEQNIVFKFRKNFFSKEEVQSAYEGLSEAAVETQNRGTAAGPRGEKQGKRDWVTKHQWDIIEAFKSPKANVFGEDQIQNIIDNETDEIVVDTRGNVWGVGTLKEYNFVFDEWVEKTRKLSEVEARKEAKWVEDTLISKTNYANAVNSGIAGWYDRYPRIPWGRSTTYTRENPEKFEKSFPYLRSLAKGFEELLPWRYNNQKKAAESIDPKFVVPGTPFTTITVNKNFRTAAHYDPANMENGFANICVVSKNDKFSGAYLVFPEIGYAVNIRPSDLLFVNNQAGLHGNTELILEEEGVERISMIAFFHEGMLKLGSYDYEETRREFVDSRRLNPDHSEQRFRWNGITPGMWADAPEKSKNYDASREWYDYLKTKEQGDEWLNEYHPWMRDYFEVSSGLEEFF
jgi:hypothetical protein